VAVDPITNSIFVPNQEDSTVSVIDGTICNAADTDGCNQHPPTVAVGFSPGTLAVDPATDTVYVPNQDENTVSVLNGAACTLTHQSGCRHAAPTTTVGSGPAGVAVDGATDTIYVTSQNDHDLSVINGATCNAAVRLACGGTWPTVATGNFPQAVAVDQLTHTVYVANLGVNTVSVSEAGHPASRQQGAPRPGAPACGPWTPPCGSGSRAAGRTRWRSDCPCDRIR
jgi:DNA-binding beta-propeller fold protein YncE